MGWVCACRPVVPLAAGLLTGVLAANRYAISLVTGGQRRRAKVKVCSRYARCRARAAGRAFTKRTRNGSEGRVKTQQQKTERKNERQKEKKKKKGGGGGGGGQERKKKNKTATTTKRKKR